MLNLCTASIVVLLPFVSVAWAQTAPGFPVSTTESLNVTYGSNNVSPAGELIPRPELVNPPEISTTVLSSSQKGVLFMIDSDVPRNGTRVPLLHWLVADVTASSNGSTLSIPGPGVAPYRQPSPPVGDSPHAYSFILFSQPDNFSVPAQFNDVLQSRVFFNISAFIAATSLGSPLAANYITVQNLTGVTATATTFPPARSTSFTIPTGGSTAGVTPSATGADSPSTTGAAVIAVSGERSVWAGLCAAALAGMAALAL